MQSQLLKFGTSISTYLLALIAALIPQRSKRVLLITSVHAHLVTEGVLRKTTLDRLNSTMNLALSVDVLKLPESFSQTIWGKRNVLEALPDQTCDMRTHSCIPDQDAEAMVNDIIAKTPFFMTYPRADMRRDLLAMLYSQPLVA